MHIVLKYFLHNLGTRSSLPKTLSWPKLMGVWARGEHVKIWDPQFISATVEASNFKFGIQVRLGEAAYQETTFTTKIGRDPG